MLQTIVIPANKIMASQGVHESQNDLFEDQECEIEVVGQGTDGTDEGEVNRVDGVLIEGPAPNDYNKATKSTVKWKDGEVSIVVDAMEDSMELLIGHIKEHEYRRMRLNRWKSLLNAINTWNEDNGTGVVRSIKSIRTKIFNLRTRSKYHCAFHLVYVITVN